MSAYALGLSFSWCISILTIKTNVLQLDVAGARVDIKGRCQGCVVSVRERDGVERHLVVVILRHSSERWKVGQARGLQ